MNSRILHRWPAPIRIRSVAAAARSLREGIALWCCGDQLRKVSGDQRR
ncbi:MAG: hypothetical protein ACLSA6_14115 [Holdemania massiliensis]